MGSASPDSRPGHVTSIRLTAEEHAALKRIAAADRRSLSNELRHLIAIRADELDREATAA